MPPRRPQRKKKQDLKVTTLAVDSTHPLQRNHLWEPQISVVEW